MFFSTYSVCVCVCHLRLSQKPSTPYLETQYGPPVGAIRPKILDMFTTRPWAFLMRGSTLNVTAMTPVRLTSSMDL